ncbi:heme o synthase [Caenispirillum bisanense]|uniref:Protoheme IX farnesyltransferase n=1 Tax=Caenispirillum bisanense TaxID=414052 RepID=A0A286GQ26_9PROT|nr:heme o synthase [Caenispirillum bisanense]SOD97189.1 protoheme IX farnesyltransferase [Caenispirillum bisanense]
MTLKSYLELCKLRIGFMIALTAMVGYAAVADQLDVTHLLLLALAMLLGSASSSVFNHFYDRDIDSLMKRTAKRPLATGAMADPRAALWLAAGLLVVGCGLATVTFNWAVAVHLFLGAFVYGIVYTVWLKRRTWLNIVIGGAAGSFAIMAGAAAVDPGQWLLPAVMAVFLFLWTPSHFWALAILLREDYAKAGVPMLPVLVGDAQTARAILFNSVLLVGSSLVPWMMGGLGPVYGVLAAAFGVHFLWKNWRLVKDPSHAEARRVFFGSMSYLGGVFLAVVLDKHLPPLF